MVEADVNESSDGLLFEHGTYPAVVLGGQRVVAFRQPVFRAMLSRIRTLLGEGGDLLLYEEGGSAGRSTGRFWSGLLGREFVRDRFPEFAKTYSAIGWARTRAVVDSADPLKVTLYLEDCFECEGHEPAAPSSQIFRGHVAGFLEELFERRVRCSEELCVSRGDDHCEFRVSQEE